MSPPSALSRWSTRLDIAEQLLLGLLAAAMVGIATTQVILRNTGGHSLTWADPFLGTAMLWITILGALAATGRRKHIAIDLISHFLPSTGQHWLHALTDILGACISGWLCAASFRYIQLIREMGGTDFADIPKWVVHFILPVGFALMSFRFLWHTGMALVSAVSVPSTPPPTVS